MQYKNAHPRHAAPQFVDESSKMASEIDTCDEMYDIVNDYEQISNLVCVQPDRAEHYKSIMKQLMQEMDAPEEQFERLGLYNI